MDRCILCALPMEGPGQTGYCSERCLLWSTLGVPVLCEDELITEMLMNQRCKKAPDGWKPSVAYPGLEQYQCWKANKDFIIEAAALTSSPTDHA